jgi:hypothetical protein
LVVDSLFVYPMTTTKKMKRKMEKGMVGDRSMWSREGRRREEAIAARRP